DFVDKISDVSPVTVTFVSKPSFDKVGTQEVSVRLVDKYSNSSTVSSQLTVIPLRAHVIKYVGDKAPTVSDFLLEGGVSEGLRAVTDLSAINMNRLGTYEIKLELKGQVFTSTLEVSDGTAPVVKTKAVKLYENQTAKPEDFVASCVDISPVTYSYPQGYTFPSAPGTYDVTVLATDSYGNTASVTGQLTLLKDTKDPVIYGVFDTVMYVGDAVSYLSGVYAIDDVDGDVTVSVDENTLVNANTAGVYVVGYIAKDRAGNIATASKKFTVVERTVSEETVTALAKQVLDEIIKPEMTAKEKLQAIFTWVHKKVGWQDDSEKDDWLRAAYQGLHNRQGDCYVYQMTSKVLLDAAGIENRLIDTMPLRYLHCWNLVNIGEGWYHFDACPRVGGFDGFYLDDATLKKYSDSHKNSHIYDHDKFPGVVQKAP
ncbi:MAG: hypothetical protein II794_02230, partial [Oscillospiraceae bacterium]|nr:hypothetical protein [Oscillospiraceae bacterium]